MRKKILILDDDECKFLGDDEDFGDGIGLGESNVLSKGNGVVECMDFVEAVGYG